MTAIQDSTISMVRQHLHGAANAQRKADLGALTARELHVLLCTGWGMTNAETGQLLGISARTVEIHRKNLITKLGAKNSPDAVRIAVSLGFDFSI